MAFKKATRTAPPPDSPDKLLLEFPRRKIPDVLPHQREVMRNYAKKHTDHSDVALQLPTGSGKTLVGLLIGEWRRRKYGERVVYLCPTKQLVHQTVEQSEDKYGLTTLAFTGSARSYEPSEKTAYKEADHVAVTTYNSVFNTNPFFDDADVLIVDDAHAAENYIANMWSLEIERTNPAHTALHTAVANILKPLLPPADFVRLFGTLSGPGDRTWVDKIPSPRVQDVVVDLHAAISEGVKDIDLRWTWQMLQDHLDACHIYLSSYSILIRPLIPPTWTHAAFTGPKQRIFMSATLGGGGDLERLTGRKRIERLESPEGWDRQGVGRRFFMFPEMSLAEQDTVLLRNELMRAAQRSLVLTPSQAAATAIATQVTAHLGFPTFNADAIEQSKEPFVTCENAVALIANRYDGIDFPGDECRLIFVDGLPKAMNLQERFLMSRMGANVLFHERVQTRILQAIGRCTRSLEDYSAVVITGEELIDYFADIRKRKYLHPEVQAELSFGVYQSKDMSIQDFLDNFTVFIENGKDWEEVNREIVADRDTLTREPFPAINELNSVVSDEIRYQEAMWNKDYESAVAAAASVLGKIGNPDLRGYRGLWNYLAGTAAWFGAQSGVQSLEPKARQYFSEAKKASQALPWLVQLSRYQSTPEPSTDTSVDAIMRQIEQIEAVLINLGFTHDRRYEQRERQILEGLESKDSRPFEEAHKLLGQLIGFSAGKREEDASPDPWWISSQYCFVFEDHQGGESTTVLGAEKARQVASHPNWIRTHVEEAAGLTIIPVLVTPVTKIMIGAQPHLTTVALWRLDEFRRWAQNALSVMREIRTSFAEPGNIEWREFVAEKLRQNTMDAESLATQFRSSTASDMLTVQ